MNGKRTGMIRPRYRPGTNRDGYFQTAPGATHRTGMPVKAYTYGGDEHDTLTAAPDLPPRPTAAIAAPSGEVLPQYGRLLALCPFCAADACFACLQGPCKCACQDGAQ